MKNLTNQEKIAVFRILTNIVDADEIVHEKELAYMNQIIQLLGFEGDFNNEVNKMDTPKALSIIRELQNYQKIEFAKYMGRMIVIDEDINYNEVKLYNEICDSCDIKNEFNIDDYPECHLSGPFENA